MNKRPDTTAREYENLVCSRCGSTKIVKDDRECGRVSACDRKDCSGCREWVSSKTVRQSFKCLDCGNTWTEFSSM